MLLNTMLALQYAGLGEEPVCAPELGEVLAYERRRCTLLERHLQLVLAEAPEHAEPHRTALAGARRRVAWLEHRLEEEHAIDEWRHANPPTAGREVAALLYYFGLAGNPFPRVEARAPVPPAPKVTSRAA